MRSVFPVFMLLFSVGAHAGFDLSGLVVGVSDGDTITVLDKNNVQYRIRLAHIDAPESRQDFGRQSKQSLSGMVYRKPVLAKCFDRDLHDRSICTVFSDGVDVNAAQVARGMAWVYRNYAPRFSSLYQLEQEAQSQRLGLWQYPQPVPPWDWRRNTR